MIPVHDEETEALSCNPGPIGAVVGETSFEVVVQSTMNFLGSHRTSPFYGSQFATLADSIFRILVPRSSLRRKLMNFLNAYASCNFARSPAQLLNGWSAAKDGQTDIDLIFSLAKAGDRL